MNEGSFGTDDIARIMSGWLARNMGLSRLSDSRHVLNTISVGIMIGIKERTVVHIRKRSSDHSLQAFGSPDARSQA
jgi:hypothetical protein